MEDQPPRHDGALARVAALPRPHLGGARGSHWRAVEVPPLRLSVSFAEPREEADEVPIAPTAGRLPWVSVNATEVEGLGEPVNRSQ